MNRKFDDWRILRTADKFSFAAIGAIAIVFLFVIGLNVKLIFEMTSKQTEEIGQMQLERIRSELQGQLIDSERTLLRVALSAEQMLAAGESTERIREFFEQEQREQKFLSNGECFNVYIANRDWAIIPTFNMPADYHATERVWYKGALLNPEAIYISEPYSDAMTGEMCFTLSTLLSDGQTVVALDETFASARESVIKMNAGSNRTALIVTKSGKIIGHKDMSLVGKKVSKSLLPEYELILERLVNGQTNASFPMDLNGRPSMIFSSATKNGWYMILIVDTSILYRADYFQLAISTVLSLVMLIAIIFLYLKSLRNRLQAHKALRAKEEFLSNLSKELRTPLRKILKVTDTVDGERSNENVAQVRESALQLSEMMDNLFSFSTIVTEKKAERRDSNSEHLSKGSRTAINRIIIVLTVALFVRLAVSVFTNVGWGDTKMNREVESYEHILSNWVVEQKSILSMFVNMVAEQPEILDNYPAAVKFLDGIAKKYPDISACYMANPYKEHQVIMNNGWESKDPNWHVDKRPWYLETEKNADSPDSFTISSPYFDDRTGNYCVTISKMVYGRNNEFLGIFGIDFYIDRLVDILAKSYTSEGYAFLVDRDGIIINHPNFSYQMTRNRMTDIGGTEHSTAWAQGEDFLLTDYSGRWMTSVARKDELSNFTVVVVNSWQNIYGQVILFGFVFLMIYLIGVSLVVALVKQMVKWQSEVQQKLQTAADAAVSAGQAKSQFLAQMSHEIRTPINAVIGMNEMILRESSDKDIREYSQNIASAGRTLLTLINSILDFSKIEDGKMEIISVRYETLNMIDDLVNMIYEKANKKNLSLITKISPTLPRSLFGDDLRIKQVITNILTNAVKYTKQGSITLTMNGQQLDDETLELFVSVVDTGIGIREEDLDKLFLSFRRLDEVKNKNIEGTGLGISIVQELLKMMGSKLQVSSVYGEGSEFSFTLRQKIMDKTPIGNYGEHHAEREQKRVTDTDFVRAPKARILAVDDTPMNQKVIKGLLKRNEIVPDLADNGQQCLELAARNFYHIIFLDHMMPEMDGVETLKRLKQMNLSPETKIIVLTANAITGAREKYLQDGFDDYLSKPIDVAALESILAGYLPAEVIASSDKPSATEVHEVVTNEVAEKVADEVDDEVEEEVGEDEFTTKERKRLAKICPSVDLATGLANCMDSKEFYIEMVQEFLKGDRSGELEAAFSEENWREYRVVVHALKSTSLIVGAVKFSERAKAQEFAARDEKADEVKANHAALMSDYKKLRKELSEWIGG